MFLRKCFWAGTVLAAFFGATGSMVRADEAAPRSPFSDQEFSSFIVAVAKAERISDPIQRCLNYPDPPGSHWSRDGVAAYCHYRLQPTLSADELVSLAGSGHAADIDRRLGELMRRPFGGLHPQEVLWRSLLATCQEPSPEVRQALDQWKRQAPTSALAQAFSGYAYMRMAWSARGGQYASDTPEVKLETMRQLLGRAKADLAKATELDPKLIISYATMINVGVLTGDGPYALQAAQRGLAVDPSSFPIYNMFELMSEPRWGGSLLMQNGIMAAAQKDAAHNPLLLTVRASILVEVRDLYSCDCTTVQGLQAYRDVFDQVATTSTLLGVGKNAGANHRPEIAYVYLSEALRFSPVADAQPALENRQQAISELYTP